jgi:hypothetical protein
MGTLKGDKAAQRKRRLQDKLEHRKMRFGDAKRGDDRTPRMEPNVRVKSYKLEDLLDDETGS